MIHAECQCSCPATYVLSFAPSHPNVQLSLALRRPGVVSPQRSLASSLLPFSALPAVATNPCPSPSPSPRRAGTLLNSQSLFLLQGQGTARTPPPPPTDLVSVRAVTTCSCSRPVRMKARTRPVQNRERAVRKKSTDSATSFSLSGSRLDFWRRDETPYYAILSAEKRSVRQPK